MLTIFRSLCCSTALDKCSIKTSLPVVKMSISCKAKTSAGTLQRMRFSFLFFEGVKHVVLPLVASGLVWIYARAEKCELNEDEHGDESMFFINAD